MRCGGFLGDFAGEIRVLDLQSAARDGDGILVAWQGAGTRCGETLGDLLSKAREVYWHVYVDRVLTTITTANYAQVELDLDAHSIVEVLGVASNVASLAVENVTTRKPGGGDRMELTWRHDGTGSLAAFRIYWDGGSAEAAMRLLDSVAYDEGRAEYRYVTDPLQSGDYRFGVVAADEAGNETELLAAHVEILTMPDAPTNLACEYDADELSVVLGWT